MALLYFCTGGNRTVHRVSRTHRKTRQCSPLKQTAIHS